MSLPRQTHGSRLHIPITIHSNRMRGSGFPEAVVALARAWNDLDVDAVDRWLAPDVCYRSPMTETVLDGIAELREYLGRKFTCIEAAGDDARVRARPGWLHTASGRQWVVISGQGDLDRAAVFRLDLDDAGRIRGIMVSVEPDDRHDAAESGPDGGGDVDRRRDTR
jgi:hypothetical protein